MKILTYNIRSWYRDTAPSSHRYWRRRAESIRHIIEREYPDVLLLQEALFPMTRAIIPSGYIRVTRGISHHIFIRRDFAAVEWKRWTMHFAIARLRLPNARRVTVASVHSHWKRSIHDGVIRKLREMWTEYRTSLIAGGDWNNEPEEMLYYPFRVFAPDCATFMNWKTEKTARIDHFALSYKDDDIRAGLAYQCSFSDSDHLPVVLEVPYIEEDNPF